jgi:hypothetical protein
MPVTLLTARSLRLLVRGRYWSEFEQQFGLLFRTKQFNMNKHDDSAKKLRRALRPPQTQPAADLNAEPQTAASANTPNGAASKHAPTPPSPRNPSGARRGSAPLPESVVNRRRVNNPMLLGGRLQEQPTTAKQQKLLDQLEARIQNTEHKHDTLNKQANQTVLDAEMLRDRVKNKIVRLKKAKIDTRVEVPQLGHLGLSPRGGSTGNTRHKESVFTSLTARSPAVDMLFPRDPGFPITKRKCTGGGIARSGTKKPMSARQAQGARGGTLEENGEALPQVKVRVVQERATNY